MNKALKILLVAALVVAVATPALAEFKFNGYYRNMMYSREVKSTVDSDGASDQFVDQRFRGKLTYSLNDNVAVVYYGEVDTVWGKGQFGGRGTGGGVGGDSANVESKNVYLDLNWGNCKARLGLQGVKDSYQGIVFFDDMAGITASHKYGPAKVDFVYSKWDENDNKLWDDLDLWGIGGDFDMNENATLGADFYFIDDNTSNADGTDAYVVGVNGDFRFGTFAFQPYVLYATGEDEDADMDINGLAAGMKAGMVIENGDVNAQLIYFAANDENDEIDFWGAYGTQGNYAFAGTNSMYFLVDKFVNNANGPNKERYAMADAVERGYGLLGLQLFGNHKLPEAMYLNWGAGYFMAADDNPDGGLDGKREGESLGFEVAARVGKKVFEKVDLSVNAAYASFGDFYDNTAGGDDPDGIYKAYLMVNVPF